MDSRYQQTQIIGNWQREKLQIEKERERKTCAVCRFVSMLILYVSYTHWETHLHKDNVFEVKSFLFLFSK